ncbi:L-Ala-D/L-Glu epimerase [Afipia felis]|uniref:L-Ala-D/L-Glu epimerase n=3 Tax=Afipia felis TaxID=1035 RepID=A0A380WB09_AFIFE|nr:hypothetical protein HMPREF9697_01896 [Afipia felis ATCC 53690]SUU78076.1 L-Ala-D/L-Glu epimerase [Afipia felis]SUU86141.1 L-Ala-D/L-Glu epimerase [Afipia felis]
MTQREREPDMPIRLKRMDFFPVAIPLKRPMKMSGTTVAFAENLFVRVESDDGTVGWGEAASAPTMTGETLGGMIAAAKMIWEQIKDCDLRFRASLIAQIHSAVYGNSSAKSAVEMSVLDLLGRSYDISIGELLGGRYRTFLEPMWMLGHTKPEDDIREAKEQSDHGYRFFKLKVGTKSLEGDIAAILGVREAIGKSKKLCADANGGLSYQAAKSLIHETAAAQLIYLEQPLPDTAITDLAKLNQMNITPIGVDESIHSRHDIEKYSACDAAAGISLKLIKIGGLIESMACAKRASELGLSINIAAKVAETSLASAAAAHAAAAIESFEWGISLTHIYLECDPVKNPMAIENGLVTVPHGPGLGIDIDETVLRRYSVSGSI